MEQKHTPDERRKKICDKVGLTPTIEQMVFECMAKSEAELLQQVAERAKENADLLAKVSEQEKEISRLNELVKWFENDVDEREEREGLQLKEHSEQSQRIQALTEQVEKAKESYEARKLERDNIGRLYHDTKLELSRLREREKELVEAINKRIYKYGVTLPSSEKDFLESLLSKFEVPKQS